MILNIYYYLIGQSDSKVIRLNLPENAKENGNNINNKSNIYIYIYMFKNFDTMYFFIFIENKLDELLTEYKVNSEDDYVIIYTSNEPKKMVIIE